MALVVGRITTGAWLGDLRWSDLPGSWWLGTLTVSIAYGVGEEPGWRGYLLPRLMERHSASVATLILALVWAAWHIPFFTYRYDFAGPVTVVGFLIAMLAGALWLSFVFLSTGGSVPAVAVWHVLWNVVNLVAGETSDLVVAVLNTAMIVLGFGVLLATRGRLRVGRADAPRGRSGGGTDGPHGLDSSKTAESP
jgi:membrane protease YdiL (CAAX protease family)